MGEIRCDSALRRSLVRGQSGASAAGHDPGNRRRKHCLVSRRHFRRLEVCDQSQRHTTPVVPRNFDYFLIIGDIVALNGQPAKGTFANTTRMINLRTAPTPGQAIGDVVRNTVNNQIFEILKSDGTPLGTITTYGLGGAGSPPPGGRLWR